LALPMIELLLRAGADPNARDADRRTAYYCLPRREKSDPQIWDAVAALLGNG
jgi:hypothetical protein